MESLFQRLREEALNVRMNIFIAILLNFSFLLSLTLFEYKSKIIATEFSLTNSFYKKCNNSNQLTLHK